MVGVDTHTHEHVAATIDDHGARLVTFWAPANRAGRAALVKGPVETSLGLTAALAIEFL